MDGLLLAVSIVIAIVSLACLIIVALGMAEDWGLLPAILFALCCSIVTFVYGWFIWKSELKWYVMPIWTLCILVGMWAQYQLYGDEF